jgi:dTDP-4-amino-4,6-dideoxygalactose transaminase
MSSALKIASTPRRIALAEPNIGPAERAKVLQALDSGWVSTVGPFVSEFEAKLAEQSGSETAAVVASGTMALHIALVALGVGPGDAVACPSFTFAATPASIRHSGAEPVFVDVSEDGWTMDPVALERVIGDLFSRAPDGTLRDSTGRRLAAVMPVYANGTPADMDALNEVACRHGLPVVADGAAAIGANYKGRSLASLADLTAYSFNGNKTITTGGGGAVVGDPALVARVKHLSTTARVGVGYDHDAVGYNYRLTNPLAGMGLAQLARLPEFLAAKTRIRAYYESRIPEIPGLSAWPTPAYAHSANWFFGVRVLSGASRTVPDLVEAMNQEGIGVRTFWKPMHIQQPYARYPRGAMDVTDAIWPGLLPLPCSTQLSDEDARFVIETLAVLMGRNA